MSWQEEYTNRYYRSRPGWKDAKDEFFDLIRSEVDPSATVLDLGAGPVNPTTLFLSRTFEAVDALDIEPACGAGERLRNAFVYDGGAFPLDDESYDAVVCDFVLEHIRQPAQTLGEIRRVLKPGGALVFRAPNLWNYVGLVASVTPHWFHRLLANRLRNLPPEAAQPYPTFYRMNTRRRLRRLLADAGFVEERLWTIEKQPTYGKAHKALFLAFMIYERVVNSCEELSFARTVILGAFRRPGRDG